MLGKTEERRIKGRQLINEMDGIKQITGLSLEEPQVVKGDKTKW